MKEPKFVNLTPHEINLHLPSGQVITVPSTGLARLTVVESMLGLHDSLPLVGQEFGETTGLPAPVEGVLYIVSALVRAAHPHRRDLGSPARLLRDDQGRIIGCGALEINPLTEGSK